MKETLLFFMQGIPEMTGVIALCFAIAKVQIKWIQTLLVGVGAAILSYTIQSLSFFFGFHTFIILFLVMLFVARVGQISIFKSFFVTSIVTIVLGMLEFSINSLYFWLSGDTPHDTVSNETFWAMLGMPQAIIMVFLAIIVSIIIKPDKKGFE
ncbi:MAG: hypothetical protein VR67_02475 [Peptococcaceae bacterium BRH_c8a]|nr:MAG: hypothetical protein VR67_02475 [Peptococcaceae bacterium BRH_c8a]